MRQDELADLLQKLETENNVGQYVYWKHVVNVDTLATGVYLSPRGIVKHDVSYPIPAGTRFYVVTTGKEKYTGYVPCHCGLFYVEIDANKFDNR